VESFQKLLRKAGFREEDYLFVLGDVIDRGENGAQLLLWLTEQPNVELILGNHEALLLACEFLFEEVTDESLAKLTTNQLHLLSNWFQNGGGPTLSGLRRILKESPELMEGILDYLRDAPLYETVDVRGKRYILVHAGLGNFRQERPLDDYSPEELFFCRPTLDTVYYPDATVIFGHTPTEYFGQMYRGKALRTDTWICIDTGAAMGGMPMLLRLDDMEEFYG
jgi:serine/threonine protein phosphatase 1